MPVKSTEDLLVDELRDIYSAKKRLTRDLPKMAKAARRREQTRGQIDRLDQVFERLDCPSVRKSARR